MPCLCDNPGRNPLTSADNCGILSGMLRASILCLILSAPLGGAGQARAETADDQGGSDITRGVELFFKGLREELGPALDDLNEMAGEFGPAMRSFIAEMGPALGDVIEEVKDWSRYDPPEILPNGDIVIRRRPDPVPESAPEPDTLPVPKQADPADSIDI